MPDVTRVLVVDDHFLFAQAIGAAITGTPGLSLAGLAVTGPQAIAMVRAGKPDVVLLDHHLPGTSSDQLIPQLHAQAPATRIIVLTSDLAEATKVAAIRAGAAGFLTKVRAVEEVVDAVLGGDTGMQRDEASAPEVAAARPGEPAAAPAQPAGPAAAAAPRIEATSAGEGHLVVRAEGVGSLDDVARLERLVGSLASVERVHATRLSDGSASLIATLRAEHSSAEVSRGLVPLLAAAWERSGVAAEYSDGRARTDPGAPGDAPDAPSPPADIRAAMADALAGTAPRPPAETVRHHERVAVSRRPAVAPPRPAVGVVPPAPVVSVATAPGGSDDIRWVNTALAIALATTLAGAATVGHGTGVAYAIAAGLALTSAWALNLARRPLALLMALAAIAFLERASAPFLLGSSSTPPLAFGAAGSILALGLIATTARALRRSAV